MDKEFLEDLVKGLSAEQKFIPSKYLYDHLGSEIFEEICELDEYYVTRAEMNLLRLARWDISEMIGPYIHVIEPGAGSSIKAKTLLRALDQPVGYTAVEVSPLGLESISNEIKSEFPELDIRAIRHDFVGISSIPELNSSQYTNYKKLVFFPGSTLGNFMAQDATELLRNFASICSSDGFLLVGVDLLKAEEELLAAYNDKKGVTARFNKNLLQRVNTEFGVEFNVSGGFKHQAVFNQEFERIEMHLVALHAQSTVLAGLEVSFEEGETILTEVCHKYTVGSFRSLAERAGLQVAKHWLSDGNQVGLFLLHAA